MKLILGSLKEKSLTENLAEEFSEKEKTFLSFINRGQAPYNYEKTLLSKYFDRVEAILQGQNPPPYEVEIQPTSKCNANCKFCFGKEYLRTEDKITTREAMEKTVNETLNFKEDNFKVENIKFCGSTGDPLLNPLTLYAIKMIYGNRFMRLFTNGLKLAENKDNKEYLETIAKVNSINLSLDAGSTPILHLVKPGSKVRDIKLEDILKAAYKIRNISEKTDMTISYAITSENYTDVIEASKKASECGVNRIRYRIDLTDRTISKKHSKEIIEMLDKARQYENENFKVIKIHSNEEIGETNKNHFGSKNCGYKCFTSKFWSCIGSDGCMYPCGHIVAADFPNYGSLLDHSFKELWNSKSKQEVVDKLPLDKCHLCSPFSLRTNEFMTELSCWNIYEIIEMQKRFVR